jgi:hypothetical protein
MYAMMVWLRFLLLGVGGLLLAGCDGVWPWQESPSADAGPPVSAAVVATHDEILALAGADSTRAAAIRTEFAAWKVTRSTYCASRYDSGTANDAALTECYAAIDANKLRDLLRDKFRLLLDAPFHAEPRPETRLATTFNAEDAMNRQGAALSHDRTLLATGGVDGSVAVYDLVTKRQLFSARPFDAYSSFLQFSANDRLLAVGSLQRQDLVFFDARSGTHYLTIRKGAGPFSLLNGGRFVLTAEQGQLQLINVLTDVRHVEKLAGKAGVSRLHVGDRDTLIVLGKRDAEMEFWSLDTANPNRPLQFLSAMRPGGDNKIYANGVAISADGAFMYATTSDGQLRQWSLPSLEQWLLTRLDNAFCSHIEPWQDTFVAMCFTEKERYPFLYLFRPQDNRAAKVMLPHRLIRAAFPYEDGILLVQDRELSEMPWPELTEVLVSQAVYSSQAPLLAPTAGVSAPAAAAESAQLRVEAIGVYHGSYSRQRGFQEHLKGTVEVSVGTVSDPLALVLSSYEAVQWNIRQQRGGSVKYVLLNSYYPSTVVGADGAEIIRFNTSHPYSIQHQDYHTFRRAVFAQLKQELRQFQGSYQGASFTIGPVGGNIDSRIVRKHEADGTPSFSDR